MPLLVEFDSRTIGRGRSPCVAGAPLRGARPKAKRRNSEIKIEKEEPLSRLSSREGFAQGWLSQDNSGHTLVAKNI
jgi:hypothetical protein